ncbi:hypothetical protein FQA47_014694, partial [Oryzias melastigma]
MDQADFTLPYRFKTIKQLDYEYKHYGLLINVQLCCCRTVQLWEVSVAEKTSGRPWKIKNESGKQPSPVTAVYIPQRRAGSLPSGEKLSTRGGLFLALRQHLPLKDVSCSAPKKLSKMIRLINGPQDKHHHDDGMISRRHLFRTSTQDGKTSSLQDYKTGVRNILPIRKEAGKSPQRSIFVRLLLDSLGRMTSPSWLGKACHCRPQRRRSEVVLCFAVRSSWFL